MFGIYSYIPVAMLWNTSLVIGDVYSRPSFDVEMAKFEGWNSLPFTEFFDYDYFSTVWSRRGVSMILLSQYNASCVPQQFTVRTVTRDPHFWPNKDAVINKMLQKSSISLPIAENTVIKFDDMYPKFTALYNFWKGGLSTKMLLLRIHRSLRPAAHLQRIIDAVLRTLPKEFVVAHIRLEGKYRLEYCCQEAPFPLIFHRTHSLCLHCTVHIADYLLHEGVLFEQGLEAAMRTVLAHPCLQGLGRGPGGELLEAPALYLASGLFNATSSSAEPSGAGRDRAVTRAQVVLERLRTMGFRAIYTRESVLNSVIAHSPDSHKDSNATIVEAHRSLVRSIRALVPEQAALVDLSVSRACSCFVSSHYRSSFSYMAQRTRQLDRGQVLRYPEINAANFGVSELFRQWGV